MTKTEDSASGKAQSIVPASLPGDAGLVFGASPAMRRVVQMLERIAPSSATVLLRGETGTGKDRVARALHLMSPLSERPFVKIDCSSLPEALLDSELFGHEKGAFTGAVARKAGRIEAAAGGTLFLDEVGELALSVQSKVLRLLQDREFERLGGQGTLRVDVRIVAATHRDLESMVALGQFRQDLFYRLNVLSLWLPPLRARRDDIEELARHFCREAASRNGKAQPDWEAGALRLLRAQPWPGNVRQLQNLIERLVVLTDGARLAEDDVRRALDEPERFITELEDSPAPTPDTCVAADRLSQAVRDAERQALLRSLARAGGNRSAAARLLGVSRSTFYAKLEEYGLAPGRS